MSKKKHSDLHNSDVEEPSEEPLPSLPGTYYGELSPGGQWFWRGTGAPDDEWIAAGTQAELPSQEDVGIQPLAASASFYITVSMTYPAGASQIGQATTYQVITPWGQSTACIALGDAFKQMVSSGSAYSGQLGNFLNNGVTRGLVTTGGATVPTSASYFQALP